MSSKMTKTITKRLKPQKYNFQFQIVGNKFDLCILDDLFRKKTVQKERQSKESE